MKNRLYFSNRTFWKNKLAPLPSYGAAWYTGKEPDQSEFNWLSGIGKRLTPISVREIGGAAYSDGLTGVLMTAPALAGLGVGYYADKTADEFIKSPQFKKATTDDVLGMIQTDKASKGYGRT